MEYEAVLVVDGLLDETKIEAEVEKAENLIKSKGELTSTDKWGKRKLAYPIKKKTTGYYTLFNFSGEGKMVQEMEHDFRFNENVLRYLVVKK